MVGLYLETTWQTQSDNYPTLWAFTQDTDESQVLARRADYSYTQAHWKTGPS